MLLLHKIRVKTKHHITSYYTEACLPFNKNREKKKSASTRKIRLICQSESPIDGEKSHIKNKLDHPQVDIREDKRYLKMKNKIEHSSETLSTPLHPYESARGRILVGGHLSIIVEPPKEKGLGKNRSFSI